MYLNPADFAAFCRGCGKDPTPYSQPDQQFPHRTFSPDPKTGEAHTIIRQNFRRTDVLGLCKGYVFSVRPADEIGRSCLAVNRNHRQTARFVLGSSGGAAVALTPFRPPGNATALQRSRPTPVERTPHTAQRPTEAARAPLCAADKFALKKLTFEVSYLTTSDTKRREVSRARSDRTAPPIILSQPASPHGAQPPPARLPASRIAPLRCALWPAARLPEI